MAGEEKSLPPRLAGTVPWECPLPAVSPRQSLGSQVQVTRGGGWGLQGSAAWWAANAFTASGRVDVGTVPLRSPAVEPPPGVTTRGGVCV